ncbi:dipeptidyl aminopeptidase/acylaminoacyl-peptidase [Acidianus hospitalis W1]|uniref:Dipeptidyl aminopeptidase/acylaminoacyl-peptidase n=1 Tax=Acidianus hospitalis (strain W1) TaxID=933801 RepID=F4B8X6_ACIHW|nr:S9 family peptidase [Acidianus hospitalis]AEE93846.1 dipeptidyl aminopeptidase/acylaminoacyl-peptidase [Acidianus hospitalis W1]
MDFQDLFKLRPVYAFDVNNGKISYVVRDKIPSAYIHDEGKVPLEDVYAEGVEWITDKKLAIIGDPGGSEKREIYIYDRNKVFPLLKDQYDNFGTYFINEDKFLFISNRDGKTLHLYLYDKGDIIQVSKGDNPVENYCLSPSKKRVVYSQGIYDNDLYVYDLDRGEVISKISYPNSEETVSLYCFKDEDNFLFISNKDNYFDIYNFNIEKEEITEVIKSEHEKYEVVPIADKIIYSEDVYGDFKIKIHKGNELVTEGFNSYLTPDQDYIYYIGSTYNRHFDLYRVDILTGKIERLTNSMDNIKGDFVKPKVVKYYSEGGIEINALLYEKGGEGKGVVYIHGGPDWECTDSFNPEIQFLVDRGFKVICPNYRGSTGYGRRFNHLNDKDLGGGDLKDIINSAKLLGVKKVAVTGGSYGGYLTMMAVTKYPDMWCSAAAVVPFVNWFTEKKFEREVLQQYDEMKMGNDENLLRDRSPIFFIDNIKSPLLILAGENDPRCPAEETRQVIEKLKERNIEVEYKIYEDEGHGFSKIENYVDSIRRVVEFIERHCK